MTQENKTTKLFNRCIEFTNSLWSGFTKIDKVLEYRYMVLGDKNIGSSTEKILYKSDKAKSENILMYLTEYNVKNY